MRDRRFAPQFETCEQRLPLDGSMGDGFSSPPGDIELAGQDDPDGSFGVPSPYAPTPLENDSGVENLEVLIADPANGPISTSPINAYA